jgi:hypothetical protein
LADSEQKSETNQKPKKQGKAGRRGRMPEFPFTIGKKPYHATIYATGSSKFLVKWKQAGKWQSTTFSNLSKAQGHAKAIADKKKANQLPDIILKQHEVHNYADIKRTCERLGVSVAAAFDEYQSAKAGLPMEYTLSDAVQAMKKNVFKKDISISELCDEFIKYKESINLNNKYLTFTSSGWISSISNHKDSDASAWRIEARASSVSTSTSDKNCETDSIIS